MRSTSRARLALVRSAASVDRGSEFLYELRRLRLEVAGIRKDLADERRWRSMLTLGLHVESGEEFVRTDFSPVASPKAVV